MAAVEFHARAHEALRNGQVYRSADKSVTLSFTLVFLALPAILYPLLGLRWAIASGCLAVLPLFASAITLHLARFWIPPSVAITGFIAGYLLWFAMYLKRTRGSLQLARRNADATLRSIADAVITVDGRARVVFMNPVAERLTGARLGDAQGQAASKFLAPFCADSRQVETMLTACVEAHEGPHKPPLVSRVSVRLPCGKDPSSEFSPIDALTKAPKDEFWPSGAGKNDHLPFWFLAFDDDDGLWHLHGHAVLYPCLTRQPTPAAPKWRAVK